MKLYDRNFKEVDLVRVSDGYRLILRACREREGQKFGPRAEKTVHIRDLLPNVSVHDNLDGSVFLSDGMTKIKIEFFTGKESIGVSLLDRRIDIPGPGMRSRGIYELQNA